MSGRRKSPAQPVSQAESHQIRRPASIASWYLSVETLVSVALNRATVKFDQGTVPKSPSLAGLPDRQLQIEDASLQGNRHSVGAVGGIELGQNALHVCFDGSLGDVELGGD